MAIFVECPGCRKRVHSSKYSKDETGKRIKIPQDLCPRCGFNLKKAGGKTYWVSYYINGRKKREKIGPSKAAAEHREREALKLRTEERFIDKDPAVRLTLGELCKWYLELPEIRVKDSYRRDIQIVDNLKRLLGEGTKIKDLTSGKVESYQKIRLSESSPIHPGQHIRPASVNREVIALKTMVNRAVRHGKLQHNHLEKVKKLPENNVRMKVLTPDEFSRLMDACPLHIRPVVMVAYYMGMRRAEIINLTWPRVDLQKGFVRLSAGMTKTDTPRVVPIHPKVRAMLEKLPRGLHTDRVFLKDGQPFQEFKRSFSTACRIAGIQDFVFHDLRHCALNNLRRSGNDFFEIMALSGHKTMSCFKRYNLVTEDELAQIKWPEEGPESRSLGTSVGTTQKEGVNQNG